MSTGREGASAELLPTSRHRRNVVALPVDPTDEELVRAWTLSEADKALVSRHREEYQHSFAIQLCVMRAYGRSLADYRGVPVRILNHVGQQLHFPPVLVVSPPPREATDLDHERRIREYLGIGPFEKATQQRLERWVQERATEGLVPDHIYPRAEDLLRSWKVLLPSPSTLERLIDSACARAQDAVFERVERGLSPERKAALDALLDVPEGDQKSTLFRLREYPPGAKAPVIASYIRRYHLIRSVDRTSEDLAGVAPDLVRHLANLTKQYDVANLKRFAPPKRHAMIACLLSEARKTILDLVVEMNDQFLTELLRHSRKAFEARHRDFRRKAKDGMDTLAEAVAFLLDHERPRETALTELLMEKDEASLLAAIANWRTFTRIEERGLLDELGARYSHLRRYLPEFFRLPFEAEPGNQAVLDGIALVQKLDANEIDELPVDSPSQFVPPSWRFALEREDGTPDRRVWETALALAVRDRLRSGALYLSESRQHVSFWNLVYNEHLWAEERPRAYAQLSLPMEADGVPLRLSKEFDDAARHVEHGLSENPFAAIENGRLRLKQPEAIPTPRGVGQLRRVIEAHLPPAQIEDLLVEVDSWCDFTKEFRPEGGYEPRAENLYVTLLAALIAQGTNFGITAMARSADGVTVDSLQHVCHRFIREETLRAANAALVNYHHRLAPSSLWGEGTISSSDGQRFVVRRDSLLSAYYPRYFGYYERAVTVYTHVSDQYSVFGTRAISCAPREALWVLDGLLENNTVLRPHEHATDTHGYTEHIFGLCYLLGYSFTPRIRDLGDQQLYKTVTPATYGRVEGLFKGKIDMDLVREQWDSLVRVAASLANHTSPAHVIVQRLISASPSDRLAKALTHLGRAVKTIYILRYIQEEDLRRRVQLQLNRGESRHELARVLFFANCGEFQKGDYEEIMNKATALSLLSNAVLVWNTVKIGEIVDRLRAAKQPVEDAHLARISPLLHAHVTPSGKYRFEKARQRDEA